MPLCGTGWSFALTDDKSTAIRSAYCPICRVKTVEIQGLYEPVFASTVPGLEKLQGCITAQMLCCSEQCRAVYADQLQAVNSLACYGLREVIVDQLAELGALDESVAESIQGLL